MFLLANCVVNAFLLSEMDLGQQREGLLLIAPQNIHDLALLEDRKTRKK